VYALGILLFRILTGSTPFTGQTPVEVLLKHVRQQPPSVRSFVPTISNAVDEVLQLAMRKRSDDRYASVEEFAKAFAAAVYVAPIASPLSQPIAMGNRQPAQSGAKTSQLVPPSSPALIGNPETPLPPNVTLNTSLPAATSLTREFSPPTMTTPLKEKAAAPSTTEPVERKEEPMESFLDDNTGDHKSLLWTVDPAEWSPIVREDAEDAVPHIPFTATDYVQSKPLILPSVEETKQEQKIETFNVRLKKLLPLLVVILLLIGLLGAMLSAFLYPTNKSGAYSPIYLTSHTIVVYEQ
jgi:serine/threonine protein kinase